jgi:polysaccharide deacetylase family protein (PEP-CTERM system associated)
MWAFDILGEEGICFDSSIFPVRHDLYGVPDAERFPSWYVSSRGHRIFEFPPSTIRWSRQNIGVGGGGYLRLPPYQLTYWAFRHINETRQQPAMVYFHPWEIDPDQPRLRGARTSVLRQYTNLSAMEGKIERLLQDFRFGPLSQVCKQHKAYLAEPAGAGTENRVSALTAAAGNR